MTNDKNAGRKPTKSKESIDRYNTPFATVLRKLITEKGCTHDELSKAIDVSRPTVGSWCLGNSSPDINTAGRIADYFGVSLDYLLNRSTSRKIDEYKAAHEVTGLSDLSIEKLHKLNIRNKETWFMNVCDDIISNDCFSEIIRCLTIALTRTNEIVKYGAFETDTRFLGKMQALSLFQSIIQNISEKYENNDDLEAGKRLFYGLAYDRFFEKKITDKQLQKTFNEFDNGNFDYDPLDENE